MNNLDKTASRATIKVGVREAWRNPGMKRALLTNMGLSMLVFLSGI
jgi:hypothetical protein